MTDEELKVTKRALTNILNSMIKAHDAPASAEMHLIESVVDLSRMLNIQEFNDKDMNEQFKSCQEVMAEIRTVLYSVKNV